jgi:hypothetical protein
MIFYININRLAEQKNKRNMAKKEIVKLRVCLNLNEQYSIILNTSWLIK